MTLLSGLTSFLFFVALSAAIGALSGLMSSVQGWLTLVWVLVLPSRALLAG